MPNPSQQHHVICASSSCLTVQLHMHYHLLVWLWEMHIAMQLCVSVGAAASLKKGFRVHNFAGDRRVSHQFGTTIAIIHVLSNMRVF